MNNKNMGLLDSLMGSEEKDMFSSSIGTQFDYYLSGVIESPEMYTDMFHQIRNASPNDTINLHINSPGGSLATALQFFRCLGESPANIVSSVEGECMSAATIIMMQSDSYLISPHSMFMFHNYSGGVFGKGGEMMDQLEFERAWSTNLLHDVYKDFLTEDEVNTILDNRDIWLTSDEVSERLQARADKMVKADD